MFKQLETFCTVYETRNFSHAAEQLFISQPTVSTQIKQLEADLQTTLFTRNGRQEIVPTASGQLLYQQAQKLLTTWAATKTAVQSPRHLVKVPCRIGASHTTGRLILPTLLANLSAVSDRFDFQVTLANSAEILTAMSQHKLEFGLVEKPLVTDQLNRLPFGHDELVHAGDFASPLWLLREPNSGVRHYTNAFLKARNIQPAQVMVIHSNQIIADLLAHGIGQTIISRHVLTADVPVERLSAHYQRQFFLLTNTQPAATLRPVQAAITQYLTTWSD
ncbi:LysR family transcriptional regulator [Lactiplantibacillus paraplantarum]|uniref:LysR family transcriptional regulator n=1 Tax=Lactiplantibacillus paraplantarum TaxID=60520 RepID=UPI002551D7E0|nr:LysR family transcriptional regulator [Lactiplantibacillus paraplantarum]MDL2063222.1 LysR family transcriptional regulator [Lactiplantibacillus paraplantarum]